MAKYHDWQRERSKTRKLRKQDKRAAALLIATERHIKPKSFGDGCDGRWSYRRRGRRVVPVDKVGAMVRAAATDGAQDG